MPLDVSARDLADYWRHGFDWRNQEARLNEFPQFTTEIDGQTIHFLHVRSPEPDALPLIMTHGWPGSVAEFMEIVGPLTDPRAHGGDPADAFHIVAPSLPGFGFSVPLREPGWHLGRTTDAFAVLMDRLGYDRYATQGGDIGAGVAGRLAGIAPDRVIGVHITSDQGGAAMVGEYLPMPEGLTEAELARLAEIKQAWSGEYGYFALPVDAPANARLRPGRLAGRAAGLDRREVQDVDQSRRRAAGGRRRPRSAVDQREHLLVHETGRRLGQLLLRERPRATRLDNDIQAPQGWAVFNTDPIMKRLMNADGQHPPLFGVQGGRPFPGDGSARSAGRRRANVLPGAALRASHRERRTAADCRSRRPQSTTMTDEDDSNHGGNW